MRPYSPFQKQSDYWVPLLELLADMPGKQGNRSAVARAFLARYQAFIAGDQLSLVPSSRSPRWLNHLTFSRSSLLRRGLLDSPRFGIWRITAAALRWLQDYPTEIHLHEPSPAGADSPRPRRTRNAPPRETVTFRIRAQWFTLSRTQVLAVARQAIAEGLPPEARRYKSWVVELDSHQIGLSWLLRKVTGLDGGFNTYHARNILGGRLGLTVVQTDAARSPKHRRPPRLTGSDEERAWLGTIRREVGTIRSFLWGRADRPSDEHLCDWVQLCYTFELYREGHELFTLVDADAVNPWLYDRARKLARICELKGKE